MIILSAGHNPQDPGACYPKGSKDWCEHTEAVDWVEMIAIALRSSIKVGIVPTGNLIAKVAWVNQECKRNNVKLAAEIHFNSEPNYSAKGSETLYCPGSIRGAMMAKIVQDALSSVFSPNRGIKEGWYRMDKPGHSDYAGDVEGDEKQDYWLKQTDCTALIVEPEFIFNRTIIDANRIIGCQVIAESLLEASRK